MQIVMSRLREDGRLAERSILVGDDEEKRGSREKRKDMFKRNTVKKYMFKRNTVEKGYVKRTQWRFHWRKYMFKRNTVENYMLKSIIVEKMCFKETLSLKILV